MKLRRLLFLFIALITSTFNFGCSVFKEKNISVIKHAGLDATNVIVDLIEPNELIAFNYEGDNLLVDWGDGYVDNLAVHVYDTALKTVTIQIFGDITSISFCDENGIPYSRDNDYTYAIAFANSVTHIPPRAFVLKNLNTVFISRFLTNIGEAAFCSYTYPMTFCCGVSQELGGWDENWHANLLGQDVVIWEANVSSDNDFLYVLVIHERHLTAGIMTSINLYEEHVLVPDVVRVASEDYVVSKIFDYAFMDNLMYDIKISSNIEYIGDYAFYNCSNLTQVVFDGGSNLVSLGDYAFGKCVKLTNISLGNQLQGFGEGAFYNCISLSSIVIPASVNFIDNLAFSYSEDYETTQLKQIDVSAYTDPKMIATCFLEPFLPPLNEPLVFLYHKDLKISDFTSRYWPEPNQGYYLWQAI